MLGPERVSNFKVLVVQMRKIRKIKKSKQDKLVSIYVPMAPHEEKKGFEYNRMEINLLS